MCEEYEYRYQINDPLVPDKRCENCRLGSTTFSLTNGLVFCLEDAKEHSPNHTCIEHKNWTINKGRVLYDKI